jgi:hypothetical protein
LRDDYKYPYSHAPQSGEGEVFPLQAV